MISENSRHLHRELGDGVHEVGIGEDGRALEPISQFDYGALDGAETPETVEVKAAAEGLATILLWICGNPDGPARTLSAVGARAASLLFFLRPGSSRYESLTGIAAAANITRAALSKALLGFRDEVGLTDWNFQRSGSREAQRETQLNLYANGRHGRQSKVATGTHQDGSDPEGETVPSVSSSYAPMDAGAQVDGDA